MFLFKLKASLVKDIYNKIHSTFFALSHSQHLAAVTSLLTFLLFIFGPKGFFFLFILRRTFKFSTFSSQQDEVKFFFNTTSYEGAWFPRSQIKLDELLN